MLHVLKLNVQVSIKLKGISRFSSVNVICLHRKTIKSGLTRFQKTIWYICFPAEPVKCLFSCFVSASLLTGNYQYHDSSPDSRLVTGGQQNLGTLPCWRVFFPPISSPPLWVTSTPIRSSQSHLSPLSHPLLSRLIVLVLTPPTLA